MSLFLDGEIEDLYLDGPIGYVYYGDELIWEAPTEEKD